MAQILSEGGVKPTPWNIRGPRDPRIREEWRWFWEAVSKAPERSVLVIAWEGAGQPRNIVSSSGAETLEGDPQWIRGEEGWEYELTDSDRLYYDIPNNESRFCSVFAKMSPGAAGTFRTIASRPVPAGWQLLLWSDDGYSVWEQDAGERTFFDNVSTGPHTFAFNHDGQTVEGWLDGERGTTHNDFNTGTGAFEASPLAVASFDSANPQPIEGGVSCCYYLDQHNFTDAQVAQLHRNPFGPFRPRERDVVQVLVGADVTLTADSGTYSVTGNDADLLRDLLITGESGSYSVSGSAADLLRSLLLDGESGSYSISGQDADLLRDLLIDAESGSYTVVGSAADLLRALLMSGDAGTYSVTGSAADLIASTGVTLTADPGSYSVTGSDADLLRSLQIEGEPGSYTVSGQPADLLRALLFSAEAGDYTVSGQQADLLRQLVMSGEAGSYSVSGAQATLLRDLLFDAEAGSYEVSGEDAQLVLAGAFEALNIAVSVDQPLDLSASIDQPLDLDADVDQPLDMDVDVEPQE